MNLDYSVVFEIAPKYYILDSFVEYEGYSISSKGFLPTVVDIMFIWIKFAISVHWFLKCWCSPLPSPVWPLPVYLDSWTWHSMFLCNIVALYSVILYFHHQSHPQLDLVLHSLCLFILCGIISPLISSWVPTNLGSSSFSVLSFRLFILFMGFSRQEYWNGLPFPSSVDHVLSELSTMTHPSWVALLVMAHSFIELDKAVVHVIRLVSFLWL